MGLVFYHLCQHEPQKVIWLGQCAMCETKKEKREIGKKRGKTEKQNFGWTGSPQFFFYSGAVCVTCCIHQSLEEACKHMSSNDVMQTMCIL